MFLCSFSNKPSLVSRLSGLFIGLFFIVTPILANDPLPLLGANSAISLAQEKKLGQQFYEQLLAEDLVETSPLLNQYINNLGNRLLASMDNRLREYQFFIVKSSSVNAFAVPGGYIGINAGLIKKARTQDQLASVLAHEIAHVKLRHGLDSYERAGGVNTMTALSILAGILLGTVNSEVGNALVFGGLAGGQQALVSFTRENEYEADRFGMTLLQNAGFDSRGMVEFFKILDRSSVSSGLQNIEYLRTHPINQNRISEAENRLKPIVRQTETIDYFPVFKDYLSNQMNFESGSSDSDFLKGLTFRSKGQYEKADTFLSKLYQRNNESIWYGIAYAQNLQNQARWDEAEQVYHKLLKLFPDDLAISLQLLELLKSRKQYGSALEIARKMENRYSELPFVYAQLTEIYMGLGRELQGLISEAEYHRLIGNENRAIKLYDEILATESLDASTVSRVKEKRTTIIDSRQKSN
ncbi:MAG: putative Zn-dependent protease [Candidatus Azotimanducaceae bacterium]|jgi:predicted Zn-dependent protease